MALIIRAVFLADVKKDKERLDFSIAFVYIEYHDNPQKFQFEKKDQNDALFKRFMAFREKVMNSGRLVSFWNSTGNLAANFQASLNQTIQRFPATGWMRGDIPANAHFGRSKRDMTMKPLTIDKLSALFN